MPKRKMKNESLMRLASYFSVGTALLLIGVKLVSFFYTNSLAILSSLMDSGLDLLASVVNLIAVQQSLIPADRNHRFGHGKAEALGGLTQGLIIGGSALFLLFETWGHIQNPEPLQRLDFGLGVMIFSIAMTFILISFQRYVIQKTHSVSIHADSAHYTGDILMNVGVITAMIFSYTLGLTWVDSVFAVGVAVYLLITAGGVILKASQILMDQELSKDERAQIKKLARSHAEIMCIHDLRTRNAGLRKFIQFNAHMKEGLSLEETHAVCSLLEKEINQAIPNSETFIHQEPSA